MKKTLSTCLFAAALLSMSALQARQIICPGSYRFVSTGDDVQTVINTCGKPKRIVKRKSAPASATKYWYYYGGDNRGFVRSNNILKFYNKKVASMLVANAPASSMNCPNGMVKVGDSQEMVRTRCGDPVATADSKQLSNSGNFIDDSTTQQRVNRFNPLSLLPSDKKSKQPQQQTEKKQELSRPHIFTVLIYQPESYMPESAFMFIDNKLTQSGAVDPNQHK